MFFNRLYKLVFPLVLILVLLTSSNLLPGDRLERARAFSRSLEFDYISWTADALSVKVDQVALRADQQLSEQARKQIVLDYIDLISKIQGAERHLNDIYSDPQVTNPQASSTLVRRQLAELHQERDRLAPLAESIIQDQISQVVANLGLSIGGQPLPPVLYHSTPLPTNLIISPRNQIRQEYQISLEPDLGVDRRDRLENQVDQALDVSSLVVDIGGMGLYPTMVIETSDLNTLTEIIAHEWVHNFLTLRPLGLSYYRDPALRTMNETAASIAGVEIGRAVMERYYPELLPKQLPEQPEAQEGNQAASPPVFNFRKEMRDTRLTVDRMLAEGQVEAAEQYMEQRRQVFWENGYRIRKLNQAYFAFYGAYADEPGGAAGEDPVGAAVRDLRANSPTLSTFIKRISWMFSYDQLKRAVSG
jgi:hypothetical protein